MEKGFTLIELVVVISIIALLTAIILFSIAQYINRGKDSNIAGNLAILVPAGEVYYNSNDNSYEGFCNPSQNSVIKNTYDQLPENPAGNCQNSFTPGLCCYEATPYYDAWAACARELSDAGAMAYCVDSRGMKKEITNDQCSNLANASPMQCP